jgi:purine-cytosine permease-like protein
LAAGSSYQAFGYEFKCRGQEFCRFTSNLELTYLLLTAVAINCMLAASAYTSLGAPARGRLLKFAFWDSALYILMLLIGAAAPVRFLISYEGFMLFMGGNFVLMFALNSAHYRRARDPLNRNFIWVWLAFLLANVGYFAFLLGGIGSLIQARFGVWFNQNDALHVLLIAWALLILGLLRRTLVDQPA